jgi:hypothetical protein
MPSTSLEDQADLEKLLTSAWDEVSKPSPFVFGRSEVDLPNPGLAVEGHGPIGLPLTVHDARNVIERCRKSAFGKGSETILDENVRRSWELNPDQFSLRNPRWASTISALLPTIHEKLALPWNAKHTRAELYKLLLYEEGAFFKPHQDTEKTPGMFGTLVVALPSPHQGGDLAFRHQKKKVTFQTSKNSDFGFSWATWYAQSFQ